MRILHCRMRIRRELEYKYEICCNAAGDEYELETCLGAGAVGVSLALGRALGGVGGAEGRSHLLRGQLWFRFCSVWVTLGAAAAPVRTGIRSVLVGVSVCCARPRPADR